MACPEPTSATAADLRFMALALRIDCPIFASDEEGACTNRIDIVDGG